MSRGSWVAALAVAGLAAWSLPAQAETQISVFGGMNWNLSSDAKLRGTELPNETRSMDWDGKSFELPPFWGVRGTHWLSSAPNWGIALDYAHTKAVADLDYDTDPTYRRLEFTDGNNLLMVDLMYRFSPLMRGTLVPYVGVGVGVAIPHVEVTLSSGTNTTYEYQLAGAAAQVLAGLEYKLNEQWSVFSEARFSYSHIDADLDGGGSFETDIWSPQLAIGLSYRFSSF